MLQARRAREGLLLFVALATLGAGPAPSRTLWVGPEVPAGLRLRVRGQISDLPWVLRRAESTPVALAPGEVELQVFPTPSGRRLELRLPGGAHRARELASPGAGVAADEATALALRSLLLELDPIPASPPAPEPVPQPGLRLGAHLGVHASSYGLGAGVLGLELGGRLARAPWMGFVAARIELPVRDDDGRAALTVTRAALDVGLRRDIGAGLFAEGALGPTLWWRSVAPSRADAVARPDGGTWGARVRLAVGAEAELGAGWGLELAGGAEAHLFRPRWLVERPDSTPAAREPWPIEPRLELRVTR